MTRIHVSLEEHAYYSEFQLANQMKVLMPIFNRPETL